MLRTEAGQQQACWCINQPQSAGCLMDESSVMCGIVIRSFLLVEQKWQ